MPTKVQWSYDGIESKIITVKTGEGKTCPECDGYLGHFNDCSILKKEIESGKWD